MRALLVYCGLLGLVASAAGTNGLPSLPFLYQLQNLNITQAVAAPFPIIVTDYSHDGTAAGELTAAEVTALKVAGKTVLAYLSIGEAENYRYYWNPAWSKPGPNRPAWLGPVDPQWPGNYKVRYWDPAWQTIIAGATNSYLNRILAQGFDGVYLDVVDAFEFWGHDSGADMIAFVQTIAGAARARPGHADFFVVPNNGASLVTNAAYLATISGIGVEDAWFAGDKSQPTGDTRTVITFLDRVRAAGKPVFAIEYPRKPQNIDTFCALAEAKGYTPYAAVLNLDRIVIYPHHDPAVPLTVTLHLPADQTDCQPATPVTFSWNAAGNAPFTYRLNFSGNDTLRPLLTIGPLTTTNHTPVTAKWRNIIKLAAGNAGGRIYWWVTAQDTNGVLRTAPLRELRLRE